MQGCGDWDCALVSLRPLELHQVSSCTVTFCTVLDRLRIRIHLIRIQHFRLNTDSDPIRFQGLDGQILKKFTAENFCFVFCQKLPTTVPIPIVLHKERPSYRRSLQLSKREHPALHNMKILNFFLFFWVIFALLGPDPDPQPWFWTGFLPLKDGFFSYSDTDLFWN